MKTESISTSKNTLSYNDESLTFQYPIGGKVVKIYHSDGTSVTRLLGLIDGDLVGIDIERIQINNNAKEEILRLSSIERITNEQEKIPPMEISVGGYMGWRYVYRLFEGKRSRIYGDHNSEHPCRWCIA